MRFDIVVRAAVETPVRITAADQYAPRPIRLTIRSDHQADDPREKQRDTQKGKSLKKNAFFLLSFCIVYRPLSFFFFVGVILL